MAETQRLEARIGTSQKAMIQQAADMTGRSLTDFVVSAAYERALETVKDHQSWQLNAEQSKAFVAALLGDREPSDRLKEAAERYRNSGLAAS